MNITERLEDTRRRQQELVNRMNLLEQEKQQLLQEVLRLDGQLQLLNTLLREENAPPQ